MSEIFIFKKVIDRPNCKLDYFLFIFSFQTNNGTQVILDLGKCDYKNTHGNTISVWYLQKKVLCHITQFNISNIGGRSHACQIQLQIKLCYIQDLQYISQNSILRSEFNFFNLSEVAGSLMIATHSFCYMLPKHNNEYKRQIARNTEENTFLYRYLRKRNPLILLSTTYVCTNVRWVVVFLACGYKVS